MSYINLHAQYPAGFGATEYEECMAANNAVRAEYEAQVQVWQRKKKAFDIYQGDYKLWENAMKKRSAQAAQTAASYASKMQRYRAELEAWQKAVTAYKKARDYNAMLQSTEDRKRRAVEQKYGIKLPGGCLDPAQKAEVKRQCEASGVKGLGYIFKLSDYPACALNELVVCVPRVPEINPGPEPMPPTPPAALPGAPPPPPVVADPGPKPPEPPYAQCQESFAGGVVTFGLIAVLVAGGGYLGYRQWKKRKKAA